MANGTKDLIFDLIEAIETNGHNFVVGIIKKNPEDKLNDQIEIFTNTNDEPLEKLLKVLKEHQKNKKLKESKKNVTNKPNL